MFKVSPPLPQEGHRKVITENVRNFWPALHCFAKSHSLPHAHVHDNHKIGGGLLNDYLTSQNHVSERILHMGLIVHARPLCCFGDHMDWKSCLKEANGRLGSRVLVWLTWIEHWNWGINWIDSTEINPNSQKWEKWCHRVSSYHIW